MEYGLGAFWGVLAVFGFFGIVIGIAAYVLTALGLYKLAQKQGEPNAWLAWIPIGQFYIIGKIVGEVKLGTMIIPRMDLILPLGPLAIAVVNVIPFLGQVISALAGIAYYALFIYSMYLLFKKYVPDQAVLYTILSFFGFVPNIYFYNKR